MKKVVSASTSFLWKTPKVNAVLDTINRYPMYHLHTFLSDAETMRLYQEDLVDSEVLYGTIVEVVSESDGWSEVIVLDQASDKHPLGYPGYLPSETLAELTHAESAAKQHIGVTAKEGVLIIDDPSPYAHRLLSFGTILPLLSEEATCYRVITPDGIGTIEKCFATMVEKTADVPQKMIALAEQFINQPYVWAGISGSGFDCSGFMYSLHRLHGIHIPRDTIEQANRAYEVSYHEAKPGDLLLFAYQEGKGEVHHVGMYLGNDMMIHSRTPGSRVMKTTISGSSYEPELAVVARYWS